MSRKVLQLVPALEQGGVEQVVCSINRLLSGTEWQNVVISAGGRLAGEIEANGGRHIALDLKSKNPLTYFSRAAKLRRLLKSERPDLVCAHSRVPAWIYRRAARGLGIKWLTFSHGANHISRYSRIMTAGDLVLTPSQFVAEYLKKGYGLDERKIRVVNPAVDSTRFDPSRLDLDFVASRRRAWGVASGDFVVMSVGRITPVKSLETLIEAFAEVKKKISSARLVIVGDADVTHQGYLVELKALVPRLSLSEKDVIFAGGETKIPECLSIASLVVSSNVKKPETFGLSMAEALAMGRPVVAKAFGGALDVVRDGIDGLLVRSDEPPEFAAAICKVREMGLQGIRESACERFSEAALKARLLAVYDDVFTVASCRLDSLCGTIAVSRPGCFFV